MSPSGSHLLPNVTPSRCHGLPAQPLNNFPSRHSKPDGFKPSSFSHGSFVEINKRNDVSFWFSPLTKRNAFFVVTVYRRNRLTISLHATPNLTALSRQVFHRSGEGLRT
jgi:hypothetical protein